MKKIAIIFLLVTVVFPTAPRQADAWVWGFLRFFAGVGARRAAVGGIVRSTVVRSGFRQLARRGGKQLFAGRTNAALRAARARRIYVHRGQERMRRLFSNKPYKIRDAKGKVIGKATVEGETLVFRNAQSRKLGFAQWEEGGLILYRANGKRVARLSDKNHRVIAYNNDNNYLGQFIKEQVEDQIVQFFVDAMGQRHDYFVLPIEQAGKDIPEPQRYYSYDPNGNVVGFSALQDGILYVYDAQGVELMRAVLEENSIVLYDVLGEKRGEFRQEQDKIVAYDEHNKAVGYIVMEESKAVYYECDKPSLPQAWVNF